MSSRILALAAGVAGLCGVLAGCGLNVASADLFVLTRIGPGATLTLLVNDAGTVACNGGAPRTLPDAQLLVARDLATSLDNDVKQHVSFPPSARSVNRYRVKLQDGTLTFPDTAAEQHSELAQAEQFALQVGENTCK